VREKAFGNTRRRADVWITAQPNEIMSQAPSTAGRPSDLWAQGSVVDTLFISATPADSFYAAVADSAFNPVSGKAMGEGAVYFALGTTDDGSAEGCRVEVQGITYYVIETYCTNRTPARNPTRLFTMTDPEIRQYYRGGYIVNAFETPQKGLVLIDSVQVPSPGIYMFYGAGSFAEQSPGVTPSEARFKLTIQDNFYIQPAKQ